MTHWPAVEPIEVELPDGSRTQDNFFVRTVRLAKDVTGYTQHMGGRLCGETRLLPAGSLAKTKFLPSGDRVLVWGAGAWGWARKEHLELVDLPEPVEEGAPAEDADLLRANDFLASPEGVEFTKGVAAAQAKEPKALLERIDAAAGVELSKMTPGEQKAYRAELEAQIEAGEETPADPVHLAGHP